MEKQTFEKGDRVDFDRYEDISFRYRFDGRCSSNSALKRLSFTEYTLQGFSQERLVNYEEYIGKWGKFTDVSNNNDFVVGRLSSFKVSNDETYFATESGDAYNTFEPLTEEQIKVLGL
jgi:hypothetical protein|nr:MAG TPA: hypothetical protein [Caudoviricetes sp.]